MAINRSNWEIILRHPAFQIALIIGLFVALFGGPIWLVLGIPDDPGNSILDTIMILVMLLFATEIVMNSIVNWDEYPLSAFFWMDFIGTASMVFDVSFLAGNAIKELDTSLLRAARAAKLGARGARFAKIVKVMSLITLRGKKREANTGSSVEAQVISKKLMLAMSTKVSILCVAMVLVVPLFDSSVYIPEDYSVKAWAERLEKAYRLSHLEIMDGEGTSSIFEETVIDFEAFYRDSKFVPYKLEGFHEDVNRNGINGSIPGESFIKGTKPSRRDYIVKQEVPQCIVSRPLCRGDQRATIHFDFTEAKRVDAILDIATIAFVILAMIVMSFDLSRSLEVMLDVEKMANLTRIFLQEEAVDKGRMENLTPEDRGVIELMGGVQSNVFALDPNMRDSMADLPIIEELPVKRELIDSWDLDILSLKEDGQLKIILHIMFDTRIGRAATGPTIDAGTFQHFLAVVKAGYADNPYHNYVHSYDVLQVVYRLLSETKAGRWLSAVDQYALLVSALCHDIKHQGKTNDFLVVTKHDLALRYNDKSPLENMHCATLFEICGQDSTNVFFKLDDEGYKRARKVCIAAILYTDNAKHFELVKEIKMVYEPAKDVCEAQASDRAPPLTEYEEIMRKNSMLWIEVFLHLADVSHPLKPFSIHQAWASRVFDEFFAQGDEEKRLGLPVGMLNDRDKISKPGSQHGFINFLVSPLVFNTVEIFQPLFHLAEQMGSNLTEWRNMWVSETSPPAEDVAKKDADIQKINDEIDRFRSRPFAELSRKSRKSMGFTGTLSR